MFSLLFYKYVKYSAWFSLWYLLSINFLLIFGSVYPVLHQQKLHTRLKEVLNYNCFILVTEHCTMNIICGLLKNVFKGSCDK